MEQFWPRNVNFTQALEQFRDRAFEWNRCNFRNINSRKRRVLARIGGLQHALETHYTPNLRHLEVELQQEYLNILYQEELLWRQRSTCNWNHNRDRNTAFYHSYVKKRARQNKVYMLRLDSGDWCSDGEILKAKAVEYFSRLYSEEGDVKKNWYFNGHFPKLTMEELEAMATQVTKDEVRNAVFQMGPLKAPGVDGVQALFFQKHWSVVGESLFLAVRDIFDGGSIDAAVCKTLIVLIPKKDIFILLC